MAAQFLSIVFLAFVVSQGHATRSLTQITLPDETVNFISHPFYSRIITIPKWWFDTLLTCNIVYPNGVTYEVFPNSNIPDEELNYASAAEPFNACAVAFQHSSRIEQLSGMYELQSLVQHTDNTMTLTRQRFHVSITLSEVGIPTNVEV